MGWYRKDTDRAQGPANRGPQAEPESAGLTMSRVLMLRSPSRNLRRGVCSQLHCTLCVPPVSPTGQVQQLSGEERRGEERRNRGEKERRGQLLHHQLLRKA